MKYLTLFLLTIVLCFVIILLLPKPEKKDSSEKSTKTQILSTVKPTKILSQVAYFMFRHENNKKLITEYGKDFTISIIGNSTGKKVNDFNINVEYDPRYVKWKNTTNLMPNSYKLTSQNESSKVNLSGALKESIKAQIFNENMIANLSFESIKNAETKIKILYKSGNNIESSMVSQEKINILEQTDEIIILFGKKYHIALGQLIYLDDDYSISVKKINIPETSCRDCIEEVILELISQKEKKQHELIFSNGGIMGVIKDEVSYNNVYIKLLQTNRESVEVIITLL